MSSATAVAAEHEHGDHQHQFDNAVQQYDASTLGMWVFLVTEVMFFGGVFTAYVVYRSLFPDAFHHGSRELNVLLGGFNTVVLIGSSLTMALAVHSAQVGASRGRQIIFLISTTILGCVFLGVKTIEYTAKW